MGTSFAAPLVSGVAALVCSAIGTGYDNAVVVARIKNNCDPVASYTQKGRVNAFEALTESNQALHASWPAKSLGTGSYTVVAGGLEQLSSTYGGDLSFDTRSVASTTGSGGITQYHQTVSVPLTFQIDVATGVNDVVVQLEGRASVANLPLTLQAWNNVTNTYQTLVTQNLVSTSTDTAISFTIGTTAPFVTSDGTLFLRYRAVRSSFGTPVAPFTIEMDLARVKAVFVSQ
jgi:hypothetical protein